MSNHNLYDQIYLNIDEAPTLIEAQIQALLGTTKLPVSCAFVDARHLNCPLPLLKTKLALKKVSAVYLVASDPHSRDDLTAFCQKSNLSLKHWRDNWLHFVIEKH